MAERIVKVLPVSLTDAEVNERSARCTRLVREASERSVHLEATKKRAKAMIEEAALLLDGKRAEHDQLARIVGERREDREVECEERIVRADRRRIVIRLDTLEEIESHPVSDDEMRKGAKWAANYEAGRSEMRHPEEPGVLLNTRPLTDAEKQVPLPGADGEVKATTLAEAAAIAAAREAGDLPDPTAVSSRTLDGLTGFRTQEKSPRETLFSGGIEQTNAAAGPTLPTATVLVLTAENAKLGKREPLYGIDWMPTADGGLESPPLSAKDVAEIYSDLEEAGLRSKVGARLVTGRWSDELSELSASRAEYDALTDEQQDQIDGVVDADGGDVPGAWLSFEQGERIEYSTALTRAQVVALKLACSGLLAINVAPTAEFACSEPGCSTFLQLPLAHGGVLCREHAEARAGASEPEKKTKSDKPPKAPSPKKTNDSKKAKSVEDLVARHASAIDATKSSEALGLCWVAVMQLKLSPDTVGQLVKVWNAKAGRMGISAATLKTMRSRGEAPAEVLSALAPESPQPSL